jgi:hypothetical protein
MDYFVAIISEEDRNPNPKATVKNYPKSRNSTPRDLVFSKTPIEILFYRKSSISWKL